MSIKRYFPLAITVLAGATAITLIQRRHINTPPSPQTLLAAAADVQHEITRVPAHFDHISDADEIAVGDVMAQHLAASLKRIPSDPSQDYRIEAYLQEVGTRTAAHTRRKLPWRFHYIPDPNFVNAFALPGGHIFVGQGLLSLMQSEDALAAVLGHEIEHVDLRHCAERVQTQGQLHQLGAVGQIVGLPVSIFIAGYSKDQELEADRDGTTLAVQAGYSYTGILQLFDAFDSAAAKGNHRLPAKPADPIGEAAQLSLATLSGYFASHPPSAQRSTQIRRMAKDLNWPAQPLKGLHTEGNKQVLH